MPESKRFLLRLDPRLFDALRRWANEDLRSINAQIEYLLTDAARRAGRLPSKPVPRPRASTPTDDGTAPDTDAPTDAPTDELSDELSDETTVSRR
jgi:hypothetical protein